MVIIDAAPARSPALAHLRLHERIIFLRNYPDGKGTDIFLLVFGGPMIAYGKAVDIPFRKQSVVFPEFAKAGKRMLGLIDTGTSYIYMCVKTGRSCEIGRDTVFLGNI